MLNHFIVLLMFVLFAIPNASSGDSYDNLLNQLTSEIEARQSRAESLNNVPNAYERLASAYLDRAKLTGNYDDYGNAQQAIDRAFALLENKSGPYLTRARLYFAMHKLTEAEQVLTKLAERPILNAKTKSAIHEMRADIAYQRGNYQDAAKLADEALAKNRATATLFRVARINADMARFADAEKLLEEAVIQAEKNDAYLAAWLCLQRGLLDLERGRYDAALKWYERGRRSFPGWWLLDEHVAEILTLTGETDRAAEMYKSIIDRTGHPEFMDALADILVARDEADKARVLRTKASNIHEARIAKFPAAASGHALDHFLEHSEDNDRTLALARENYERRPNPRAAIQLAQAFAKAGKTNAAYETIQRALRRPYRSADLFAVAADIANQYGDTDEAAEFRAAAEKINPRIFDD